MDDHEERSIVRVGSGKIVFRRFHELRLDDHHPPHPFSDVDVRVYATKTYFYEKEHDRRHEWQASLRWERVGETSLRQSQEIHEKLRAWFVSVVRGLS